jgi:hypothetical protein
MTTCDYCGERVEGDLEILPGGSLACAKCVCAIRQWALAKGTKEARKP